MGNSLLVDDGSIDWLRDGSSEPGSAAPETVGVSESAGPFAEGVNLSADAEGSDRPTWEDSDELGLETLGLLLMALAQPPSSDFYR